VGKGGEGKVGETRGEKMKRKREGERR